MADRFLRKAGASRIVQKLTAKTVFSHGLIEDGDRILIAVSGGKDSTALAWALSAIRRELRKDYALMALHISSDFCSCCKKTALKERLARWDIPFDDVFVPVIARLKPGEKMNCYWCSTQRRAELLSYAQRRGCNKIALGHHLDDILETYFMNMTQAGALRGMPARLAYRKYPVTLIRPLALLEERQIAKADEFKDFDKFVGNKNDVAPIIEDKPAKPWWRGWQVGVGVPLMLPATGYNGFIGYMNKKAESWWWRRLGARFDFQIPSALTFNAALSGNGNGYDVDGSGKILFFKPKFDGLATIDPVEYDDDYGTNTANLDGANIGLSMKNQYIGGLIDIYPFGACPADIIWARRT